MKSKQNFHQFNETNNKIYGKEFYSSVNHIIETIRKEDSVFEFIVLNLKTYDDIISREGDKKNSL